MSIVTPLWIASRNIQLTGDKSADRFMVDVTAYNSSRNRSDRLRDDLGPMIEEDEPELHSDIYLFPPTIYGYNLRSKRWGTI